MDKFITELKDRPGKWVLDVPKVKSYNADWIIINSGRGVGKTFGFLSDIAIDICKHLGEKEMLLVARFETELEQATTDNGARLLNDVWEKTPFLRDNFIFRKRNKHFIDFAKIKRDEKGNMLPDAQHTWYTTINMLYLSGTVRRSVAYNKVEYILFDEFQVVDQGGRYLKGEFSKFMNLLSTVMRDRRVKVYMFSNSGSIINPYFAGIGYNNPDDELWSKTVSMPAINEHGEDIINKVRLMVFNLQVDPDKLMKDNVAGAFGNTDDFSGTFNLDHTLITKLTDRSRAMYNFMIDDTKYTCYNSYVNGQRIVIIDSGFNPSARYTFSDTFLMGESLKANAFGEMLRDCARSQTLYFTDIIVREQLIDFINRMF